MVSMALELEPVTARCGVCSRVIDRLVPVTDANGWLVDRGLSSYGADRLQPVGAALVSVWRDSVAVTTGASFEEDGQVHTVWQQPAKDSKLSVFRETQSERRIYRCHPRCRRHGRQRTSYVIRVERLTAACLAKVEAGDDTLILGLDV